MAIINDLTGQIYGKLLVLSYSGRNKFGISMWLCLCECGSKSICNSNKMRTGEKTSCGCHKKDVLKNGRDALHLSQTKHGKSKTREHHIWMNIKYRCYKKTSKIYQSYGGRGITVCDRWMESFENFLHDMGPLPSPSHTIDRINNDGPYSPENCRWATMKQQSLNRRNNRILTYKGESKTVTEWSSVFGINRITLFRRLNKGWSIEKALETPVKGK